jgi:MFS transporter, OFA family, oxalate/formate antiporter
MNAETLASPAATSIPMPAKRWWQLVAGLVCMMAISSPQYVWTLFTKPLTAAYGVPLSTLQVTFSILIVLQTFSSPFQGWLVDRFGPRLLISAGSLLTGLSWLLASGAGDVTTLYLTYGFLGGIGTGIVYIGVVGLMVKWFPDKRGLAVGTVAAGYGMGAMLTTFPISSSIAERGLQSTLITFGIGMGLVGFIAAQFLRAPPDNYVPAGFKAVEEKGVGPGVMVRNPIFWLMFVMMTMMSTSGLMVTSQLAAFAKDAGVTSVMVWGLAAVPLALTIDRICNGLTRPLFGFISDRIGRENTMFIAFLLEAAAMTLWLQTSDNAVLFVLLSGVVFLGWGEIFSLFPSTLTDTFGARFATVNYGCLYIAQGIGSILGGPLAALLREKSGSWTPVFSLAIGADVLTALLALFVLKAMRKRYLHPGST